MRWLLPVLLAAPAAAQPCDPGALDGPGRIVESARHALAFRTEPPTIPVGAHFALEFRVCAAAGTPAPDVLAVDGRMPAHGHGMNYAPGLTRLPDGRHRAEGLMFHMPGRWELVFDLKGAAGSDRLIAAVNVE
jgi:hypothetical protein